MKIFRLVALASVAAAMTLLSTGAAQAYPDSPNVTITGATLVGGGTFSYTAQADVSCTKWTITYAKAEGQSATQGGSGKTTSGSYDTPVVSKTTRTTIKATCDYDDGVPQVLSKGAASSDVTPAFYSTSPSTALQAVAQTASASAVVTLLPKGGAGNEDDGALPDTGGSNLWILVLGGALVVAGVSVAYAARRRHSAH